MHRGYYPLSDFQAFRRMGPRATEPGPDGRPPDNRHPMDKAIAHLSGALSMKSADWAAWSATMTEPRLEGRWALTGHDPGRGPVFGEVTVRRLAGAADQGSFLTDIRYVYPRTGKVVTRTGRVAVYTGFQWRGRSDAGSGDADPLREVMFVERNRRVVTGRWFTGGYDELGMDVQLERLGSDAVLTGVDRAFVKAGANRAEVRVFGANLPTSLSERDISLGPGVKILAVRDADASGFALDLAVAADAPVGRRDLVVAGAVKERALLVYDKVHALKVRPQAGLARVGGIAFPKQLQQFEAIAVHHGPDGKPDTADDLEIGAVEATWALEEYTATFGDDDLQFVGTLSPDGLFTPNVDGPNPKRRNNTNNYGDVWVVATHTPPGEKALRARAHLLVTVPLYIRFDRLEGSQ
jgi:quinohemoprotein amine dehydrogenase